MNELQFLIISKLQMKLPVIFWSFAWFSTYVTFALSIAHMPRNISQNVQTEQRSTYLLSEKSRKSFTKPWLDKTVHDSHWSVGSKIAKLAPI